MSLGRWLLLYPAIGVATSFGVAIREITKRNHLTNQLPTRATVRYLSLKISEQLVDHWPEKLEE